MNAHDMKLTKQNDLIRVYYIQSEQRNQAIVIKSTQQYLPNSKYSALWIRLLDCNPQHNTSPKESGTYECQIKCSSAH